MAILEQRRKTRQAAPSLDLTTAANYPMLRNNASGPGSSLAGQIAAELHSGKPHNRPSGRPKASRRAAFEALPTRIRPKSGRKARFPAGKLYEEGPGGPQAATTKAKSTNALG